MRAFRNLRVYFFRGMAALLPTILTILIFIQCYIFVQDKISVHINRGVVWLITRTTDKYSEGYLYDFWVDGPGKITGFFVAIIIVCFIGAFLASFVGRKLWHVIEQTIMSLPLIKKVYPYIKQVTDFMLIRKDLSFNKVVALQYPRAGVWSIGLVTGKGLKKVVSSQEKEFLTVFVPTSPTPLTGYVIMTPVDETIDLEMSIEEAFRYIVSGGVITPTEHKAYKALANRNEETSVSKKKEELSNV